MIRKKWLLPFGALIILVLLSTGVAKAINGAEAQHFLDTTRGTALTVHPDPADPDYGHFGFSVSGVGTYAGGDSDSIRQKANGLGFVIKFKGEVVFFPEADFETPGISRTVIMNAQAGPNDGHATAVLQDKDGTDSNYQMVSHSPPGNTLEVVASVSEAVESSDWATLYGLTSTTFTVDMTVEEFIADLSAQEVEVGRVVAVEVLTEPDIQFSPLGVWFFSTLTRVSFDRNGSIETEEFVDYYVLEEDQWRFWFSAAD